MTCTCQPLLDGAVYSDDCDDHSTLPPPVMCPRCRTLIDRHDPRVAVDGLPVHALTCADLRERLGFDNETTPHQRIEDSRRRRKPDETPLFMQPGRIARLRRRRR